MSPSNEPAPLSIHEGQVFAGKFRVERIVGEGSMGLVVVATHLGLDERVALKFLRREVLAQPDIVACFAREARAAVKLKSEHVARVFDVGTADDGTPFIVMEFLEGSDLGTVLEERHHLEISEAVEYVIEACEGLTEAHARGVVHRDIKPENLFLAQGAGSLRQIKVLDFGISKAALGGSDADLASHHTTQIMGSPHYMSPEQLRSTRDVDGRADIWSLGVVLFELLAGETPFTANEPTSLMAQVLRAPHQRLTALRPEVPSALEAIVDRCLAKDPAVRYATGAELAAALCPFAPKRARASVERAADIARSAAPGAAYDSVPPPPSLSAPPSARKPVGSLIPAPAPSPPRASVWGVAALVVVLALGAAAVAFTGKRTPLASPSDAPPAPPAAASAGGAVAAAGRPAPSAEASSSALPVAAAAGPGPSASARRPEGVIPTP